MKSVLQTLIELQPVSEQHAFECGWRSVIDGPNTENCHFSIFSTPQNTRAWERGAQAARDAMHPSSGEQ